MYDLNTLEFHKIVHRMESYCKTNYGKEKLHNIKPETSYDCIQMELQKTKEAYVALIKYGDIPISSLNTLKEIIAHAKIGAILSEQDLLDVVGLIDTTTNVIKYFKTISSLVDCSGLNILVNSLESSQILRTNITLAITESAKVADNASKELFTIRRNISSLENRLRSKLNELLISKASMLTESLIVMRDGRMCLPVKIEYKNTFSGILHDISSSNTTCYIEPTVTLEIANQIESYRNEEKKEILAILKNLSLLVSAEGETLEKNHELLSDLDLIFAKALFGKEYGYNDAKIKNNQSFILKKAKHPLLDPEKVVPIDIELGKKFNTIIITGPNTGGKTITLKTVGILHIMVYCGMMVPTSTDSEFGYFSEILVDIGDEQSIEQSLSTFSSHMSKIVHIFESASFTSLILLDELGSGTDPKEGSSLAMAILQTLNSYGCRVICTTHYSELKNYAYQNDGICNASVEFNLNTLLPTYRLLLGVPGKSNAIEIAKKLGLEEKIIEKSKEYLNSNSSNSSLLMNNLEEEMTNLRNKEEDLEHKINQYNEMLNDLQKEKLDLVNRTEKIIYDAKIEARKVLEKAKVEAQELLEEIKNMSEESYKEHELAAIKHKVNTLAVEADASNAIPYELQVGDYVLIKSYQKYGTITKIKKDKYVVNIGQFAMEFKKEELQLSAKPVEKPKKATKLSGYNPASHAQLSLDLRGKRYEEVKMLLDQYLDQAILGNLEFVTIIHGFGTGAIRKAVWEYLKDCPYVKSYRYGKEGEGLNGVTVVYLK